MSLSIKTLIPGLFALTAIAVTGWFVVAAFGSFGEISDLPEYYAPARMVLSGQGRDIYDLDKLGKVEQQIFPVMKDRVIGLYIPPQGMVMLVPLALLPSNLVAVL
ncbi:MAG TPA: hypothetical protein V6C72_08035, partial [Chroococcales cyanobacterium]